jgi:hypothetical protein
LLGGCEYFLRLDDITVKSDASGGGDTFDDAPSPACTAVSFAGPPLLVSAGCHSLTQGLAGVSIMQCNTMIERIDLTNGVVVGQSGVSGNYPRLTMFGEMYVMDASGSIVRYNAAGPDTWAGAVTQNFSPLLSGADSISAPSGSPADMERRMLVFFAATGSLEELKGSGNNWAMPVDLGLIGGVTPTGIGALSSNGLTMVFPSIADIYLATRADLGQTWGTVTKIYSAVDFVGEPFLSADCHQLFYDRNSGVEEVTSP